MTEQQSTIRAIRLGERIYIPDVSSFDKEEMSILGGLATIDDVHRNYGDLFITIEELPGHHFNYRVLMEQQAALQKRFGKRSARFDQVETNWSLVGFLQGVKDKLMRAVS
jgi:hypothetical protein